MGSTPIYWCEDFVDVQFEYEPVIEDGILAMGEKMMIAGPSESGKSYLLLQLALELASGGNFFGRKISRAYRTLLIQSEVMEGEYQTRTRKLAAAYLDLPLETLALATTESMKINEDVGFRALAAMVDVLRPEVVMLDPLRAFITGDENASDVGENFFTAIRVIQENTRPFCLVMAHHVRKPSLDWLQDGGGKYEARGSGIWTDRPSTVLSLSVNAQQTQWKLQYVKTRARASHPPAQVLYVDFATGLFDVTPEDGYGAGLEILRTALDGGPTALDLLVDNVTQAQQVSRRTVARWLVEAEQAGMITRLRDPMHKSRKIIQLNPKSL